VASTALAAAEANGAIPPLTARQREALRRALVRVAAAFRSGDEAELDTGVSGFLIDATRRAMLQL
jgi:hypothetical protein